MDVKDWMSVGSSNEMGSNEERIDLHSNAELLSLIRTESEVLGIETERLDGRKKVRRRSCDRSRRRSGLD
jgi:hypothetical protein